MTLKKLFIAAAFLCFGLAAWAQNLTTVSGSNITDINGTKLAAGQVCFLITDQSDTPISVSIGGGGQALKRGYCSAVTAGVITGFTVPNPAATLPTGIYYRVTVKDSSSGVEVLRYTTVSFTGATFNFDNYAPLNLGSPAPLSGNSVTGNLSVTGNVAATGTVTGSNIAGGSIATGAGTTNKIPKYTNGPSAVIGDSSLSDNGTTVATSESISLLTAGTLPATIANDTAGGINITSNGGKVWEFANGGALSSPVGAPVQFNGATSGLINVAAPAAAGANNLTLPAATDTLVGKATTDTLTNKTLTSPAINGQTADTITQKAATQFLLKDNTGGTRLSIPSNGTSPSVLNNTAIGGGSAFTGTLTTPIQGIACADLCVQVITGTPKHLTGQTATITNSAIGTIGTDIATGTYSAHASCITTTSGTGTTATPTITWTDAGGAKTLTLASIALNSTTITGYDNGIFPIHPTSGAVNLNVSGTFGTSVYACDAWLTREN